MGSNNILYITSGVFYTIPTYPCTNIILVDGGASRNWKYNNVNFHNSVVVYNDDLARITPPVTDQNTVYTASSAGSSYYYIIISNARNSPGNFTIPDYLSTIVQNRYGGSGINEHAGLNGLSGYNSNNTPTSYGSGAGIIPTSITPSILGGDGIMYIWT